MPRKFDEKEDEQKADTEATVTADTEIDAGVSVKKGPVEDKQGQGKVMEETMLKAENIANVTQHVTTAIGGTVGAMGAGALYAGAQTVMNKATSTPETKGPTQEEVTQGTAQAMAKGGLVGSAAGSMLGTAAKPLIRTVARNIGAHECDECKQKNIYDYYQCQQCKDFDLCKSCYASFKAGVPVDGKPVPNHDKNHMFDFHDNSSFALRYIVFAIVAAIVLRWLARFIWPF